MDLKSGPEGHRNATRDSKMPSTPGSNVETGQGPQHFPNTRDFCGHGEEKRRTILEGSPEHLCLQEAKVICKGGRYSQGRQRGPGEDKSVLQNSDHSQNPKDIQMGIGKFRGQ